jgi:hypothetical protein
MAEVREQRKRERAQGREQRRARVGEPIEQIEDAAEGGSRPSLQPQLRRALTTAATAGLVGALAGAAKAFADRRGESTTPPRDEDAGARQEDDEVEDDANPERAEGEPRDTADDDTQPQEDSRPREPDDEHEFAADDRPPERGAESRELAEIIEHARQHVEDVTGSDVESVSGIERSNGNWSVSVEVVQMRRVPESTDVLASYAVVMDDDGGLVSLQQIRRYRRSQADEER